MPTNTAVVTQLKAAIAELRHPRFFLTEGTETTEQFQARMARGSAVQAMEAAIEQLEPSVDPFARARMMRD